MIKSKPNKARKTKIDIIEKQLRKLTTTNNKIIKKKKNQIKPMRKSNPSKKLSPQVYQAIAAQKKQQIQRIINILDPWSAVDAKLPQIGENYSNTAKVKTYFNLTMNASGKIMIYFDPNWIEAAAGTRTSFLFNNDVTMLGTAALNTATYSGGPTGSVPVPPSTTVLKTRLVSAAMKVTPKVSNLNYVGTVLSCIDYGDYDLRTAGSTGNAEFTNVQQYTNFTNIINGNGGKKYDLANPGQSIYFNWYPVDPLSDVFVTAGNFIADSGSDDAGGSPRFVVGLQDFPASSPVDIEIVWNIEYLSAPVAKPWLGYTSAMSAKEFDKALTLITKDDFISLNNNKSWDTTHQSLFGDHDTQSSHDLLDLFDKKMGGNTRHY